MAGKRSNPHPWWARHTTLTAVGAVALVVWLSAGAWMLFAPRDPGPYDGPETGSPSTVLAPTQAPTTDFGYDPTPYTGPLKTPKFTPRPSPGTTGGSAPAGSDPTSQEPAPPQPTAQPTTATTDPVPGNGHGHGHTKGPKR